MMAELQPLNGKYYGTFINYKGGTIKLWIDDGSAPSQRYLKWGRYSSREDFERCDSHYETLTTYQTAIKILEALNEEIKL